VQVSYRLVAFEGQVIDSQAQAWVVEEVEQKP
jgi:hypothetical protein